LTQGWRPHPHKQVENCQLSSRFFAGLILFGLNIVESLFKFNNKKKKNELLLLLLCASGGGLPVVKELNSLFKEAFFCLFLSCCAHDMR
jgi:hypothetical protein